ncbi:MAG: hypothetical protein DMG61_17105 [Acidobacteria bacterium]|nr:MAG: hypothetical protein DMG61_17105 [Acidobacteriota bacterium]
MSSDSIPTPVKETIYDGPEVDLFKRKQPASAAFKETVHAGDVPEHITRRFTAAQVAQLSKPQTETVHEGGIPEMFAKLGRIAHDLIMPDRETIYQGPELRIKHVEDVTYLEKVAEPAKADEPVKEKESGYLSFTQPGNTIGATRVRALLRRGRSIALRDVLQQR